MRADKNGLLGFDGCHARHDDEPTLAQRIAEAIERLPNARR